MDGTVQRLGPVRRLENFTGNGAASCVITVHGWTMTPVRSPAQLSVKGHELQAVSAYQPCADKSSVQICTDLYRFIGAETENGDGYA